MLVNQAVNATMQVVDPSIAFAGLPIFEGTSIPDQRHHPIVQDDAKQRPILSE